MIDVLLQVMPLRAIETAMFNADGLVTVLVDHSAM